jgi:hypothetical protein
MVEEQISRFEAKLLRPASETNPNGWTFLHLPQSASDSLPSRGQVAVEALIGKVRFLVVVQPNGHGGHWLKIDEDLRTVMGVNVGDLLCVEIVPSKQWPEPDVPAELEAALADLPRANSVWLDITAAARTDWVFWIDSAKKAKTRLKRIETACDMLANGKRRVCCFDRSRIYSKSISSPVSREDGKS